MSPFDLGIGLYAVGSIVVIVALIRLWLGERRLRAQKATSAFRLGASQKAGDLSQVLGTFGVLTEYDEVILLSSTSAQSSLDLMGLKGNQLDLIEFKKDGTPLSRSERRLKQLVLSGQLKVAYRVVDVRLPDGASLANRPL